VDSILLAAIAEADTALFEQRSNAALVKRQFLLPDVTPSQAAASAARRACDKAGVSLQEIDFVISATQTPDFNNPGLVSLLLAELGLSVGGLEIKQGIHGGNIALGLARSYIQTGMAKKVLVAATDILSRHFVGCSAPRSQQQSAAEDVFADGAVACVVTQASGSSSLVGPTFGIRQVFSAARGQNYRDAYTLLPSASQFPLRLSKTDVEQGRHFPAVDAASLLEHSSSLQEFECFLAQSGLHTSQINNLCFHNIVPEQINKLVAQVCNAGGKAFDCFESTGYIGAAGTLTTLARCTPIGARVILGCAGAGPSWSFVYLDNLAVGGD
jgi:3-oxoacyl-[acyl-carrier-protein] synthase III